MTDLDDVRLGLSPSLLGANAEAVAPRDQVNCPSPADARLRVANLCRTGRIEYLVVNPSHQTIALTWETGPIEAIAWRAAGDATLPESEQSPLIPPRGWLCGVSSRTEPAARP